VTYSDYERDLGRLRLGRHGTSPQGLLEIAARDVCVRPARVHNVRGADPRRSGSVLPAPTGSSARSTTPASRSVGFQCWSGSVLSTICCTRTGMSVSPALMQAATAAVSWFSASFRSV
jgi:hypothetical protein